MMKQQILKLIFLFITINLYSQQQPYFQQRTDYSMNIDMDIKTYQYQGTQTIKYTNNSPDALNKIYFHLYWNAFQPESAMDIRVQWMGEKGDKRMLTKENESRISKLTRENQGFQNIKVLKINGENVNYQVQGTVLEVDLKTPIKSGETANIDMEWIAQVPEQIRRSGKNNAENVSLSMTQWYPKIAEYDYEGWHAVEYVGREFHGVFGNFDVTIHIDKDYIIGAGGVLQNPLEVKGYEANSIVKSNKKNQATWHYKADNIHDFAWAADPDYTVEKQILYNQLPIYYIYQKSPENKGWEAIKPIINDYFKVMNETFGTYPYPNYSFIQGGDGGMEYGMCTLLLWNKRKKSTESEYIQNLSHLMVHESAHSWFQQILATNESMRAWMDEGYTTYAEEYTLSKIKPEWYEGLPNPFYETTSTLAYIQESQKEEPMGYMADHYNESKTYSIAAYVKGASFLVGLGYIVGEENLAKIMKEYYTQWKFKHPTEKDFLNIAQTISGMDLKWYFNYMITSTRTVDYELTSVTPQGKNTQIDIKRIGEFPMPLDIYVFLKDGSMQVYNIPLSDMRGEKTSIGFQSPLSPDTLPIRLQYLPDISWVDTTIKKEIPVDYNQIKKVFIDYSFRMLDVNYDNNGFEAK